MPSLIEVTRRTRAGRKLADSIRTVGDLPAARNFIVKSTLKGEAVSRFIFLNRGQVSGDLKNLAAALFDIDSLIASTEKLESSVLLHPNDRKIVAKAIHVSVNALIGIETVKGDLDKKAFDAIVDSSKELVSKLPDLPIPKSLTVSFFAIAIAIGAVIVSLFLFKALVAKKVVS